MRNGRMDGLHVTAGVPTCRAGCRASKKRVEPGKTARVVDVSDHFDEEGKTDDGGGHAGAGRIITAVLHTIIKRLSTTGHNIQKREAPRPPRMAPETKNSRTSR